MKSREADRWIAHVKAIVFFLCTIPLAWLAYLLATGALGANPIEEIIRSLGDWALRILLLTLTVTPARHITGWAVLLRFRRMLGLFAFAYALFHLGAYIALDKNFDLPGILEDIVKRPYITFGMMTFSLLVPLALTSTNRALRSLGGKRWRLLHRLVYPASIGAVVHYYLMVKADVREPLIYAGILALLLGYRLVFRQRSVKASARPARQAATQS